MNINSFQVFHNIVLYDKKLMVNVLMYLHIN